MKNSRLKISLLIIACLILVTVGVAGLSAGGCDGKREVTPAPVEKTESADGNFGDLMDVGMPGDILSQKKDYSGFRISFNKDNATPNWVAWELLGTETSGVKGRTNKFWKDDEIENCPVSGDYSRSGYDRGHLCPAADQKWSDKAMEDCFVMANICPQDHALNAGAWNTLENKTRSWASRDSVIYIVAGPIYESSDRTRIGQTGVRVPSAFFKVLLAPYCESPRGIGFVYPNMSAPGNMQDYAMTIDDVEKLTGFDFFHSLPDNIENEVESRFSFKEWNRRR